MHQTIIHALNLKTNSWHKAGMMPPKDPKEGGEEGGEAGFLQMEGMTVGCIDGQVIMAGGVVECAEWGAPTPNAWQVGDVRCVAPSHIGAHT